jgi:hypothetical protein
MNVDPDKNDEELQKMLALKRLETPPPRFFRGFSDKVIDGLNSPQPTGPRTVWQRLGLDFDSRPVLVCASGVVVCGLLGTGVILAVYLGPARPAPLPAEQHLVLTPAPTTQPAAADLETETTGSTDDATGESPRSGNLNQPVIMPADSTLTVLKPDRSVSTSKTDKATK